MATKLYPPMIEGTIPACYGTTLVVPYSHNKAVSINEVKNFIIKIKTVQNNIFLLDEKDAESISFTEDTATFDLSNSIKNLNIGQHYKVQMAYINQSDEIGYYSTVGVVKYTAEPDVYIEDLDPNQINYPLKKYVGVYSQENRDIEEKVYSYSFNLYDSTNNLIYTTGELIHDNSLNIFTDKSHDEFEIPMYLEQDVGYLLEYKVTTVNGLEVSSLRYHLENASSVKPYINSNLVGYLDRENAYINLFLEGKEEFEITNGSFQIIKTSSESNYKTWEIVYDFKLRNHLTSQFLFRDFMIKQGVIYKYALQQYNKNNILSDKLESNKIYVEFEHMFLFDKDKQLKLKFDPMVSSFKEVILESKVDTLGNQFPYFFRNGDVRYKEFQLSGLISYHLDEQNLFDNIETASDFERYSTPSGHESRFIITRDTNLTDENFFLEREFKLKVLEWLNNGEPKCLKTPAEGNYLVRLMNVNLTPNDTLSRMIHTFSASAYEIGKLDYKTCKDLNLLPKGNNNFKSIDIPMSAKLSNENFSINNEIKGIHLPIVNPRSLVIKNNNLSNLEKPVFQIQYAKLDENGNEKVYYDFIRLDEIGRIKKDFENNNMNITKVILTPAFSLKADMSKEDCIINDINGDGSVNKEDEFELERLLEPKYRGNINYKGEEEASINLQDIVSLYQHLNNIKLITDKESLWAADADGDGQNLSIKDLEFLYDIGKPYPLGRLLTEETEPIEAEREVIKIFIEDYNKNEIKNEEDYLILMLYDLNGDGKLDEKDLELYDHLYIGKRKGDLNGDGVVDEKDFLLLNKYLNRYGKVVTSYELPNSYNKQEDYITSLLNQIEDLKKQIQK